MNKPITGYAEGYYGRLLSWAERHQILDVLQHLGLTSYYYAPKEDIYHRLHWRRAYTPQWRHDFQAFCLQAEKQGIQVVAGVAPGLDFDFSQLPDGEDFHTLVIKCQFLLEDGAHAISLLMDDIDADFDKRCGDFVQEGHAHAQLANALGRALTPGRAVTDERANHLWVTPRIYADELIETAVDYLPAFLHTLHHQHHILYCGSDVVAASLDNRSLDQLRHASEDNDLKHRVIIWDNLYANDYCPRRLFIGAWQNRHGLNDILLNPTGMVHTDCLLLELMAEAMKLQAASNSDKLIEIETWRRVLSSHGIPDAFLELATFFYHPVFNSDELYEPPADSQKLREAIEYCLWRWKTPLSREWYAAIFGLKHDLLTGAGEHPLLRIRKTQNAPLAEVIEHRAPDTD